MDLMNLVPHGFCIKWTPQILYPMVLGDLLLFVSYMVISGTIFFMLKDHFGNITLRLKPIMYLFGLFILSCGLTHLMAIVVVWKAHYFIQALIGLFAGLVSAFTAIVLIVQRKELIAIFKTAETK